MTEQRSSDTWFTIDEAIGSGESISKTLEVRGGDRLTGLVTRVDTAYDIDIEWLNPSGSVVHTESVASSVTAGTTTEVDEDWHGVKANVIVSDAGTGSGTADINLNVR